VARGAASAWTPPLPLPTAGAVTAAVALLAAVVVVVPPVGLLSPSMATSVVSDWSLSLGSVMGWLATPLATSEDSAAPSPAPTAAPPSGAPAVQITSNLARAGFAWGSTDEGVARRRSRLRARLPLGFLFEFSSSHPCSICCGACPGVNFSMLRLLVEKVYGCWPCPHERPPPSPPPPRARAKMAAKLKRHSAIMKG